MDGRKCQTPCYLRVMSPTSPIMFFGGVGVEEVVNFNCSGVHVHKSLKFELVNNVLCDNIVLL